MTAAPTALPPHDLDAECAVLGACMHDASVIDEVRPLLEADAFYRPAHATIWQVLLSLRGEDLPTDPIAVNDRLSACGDLQRVGGVDVTHRMASTPYGRDSAAYHAEIVSQHAERRRLLALATVTLQRAQDPSVSPETVRTQLEAETQSERERALASGQGRLSRYLVDGWRFVTETGAEKDPLWGTPEKTAWASGESLMIVGAPGVGKTTLAHQVVLARLGLQGDVLDMPVAPTERVLYLAMDRPQQIARAMSRRVAPHDMAVLRDRLSVWQGPLPTTLDKEPDLLAELAASHRADTIVIDSLKDAASTLVDDALAIAYNNARMRALRNGVEVMELHHQRKATADAPRGQRPTLDRVYGSAWLVSGAGSVLFISGDAGDPAVSLHHLKTVTGEIGPLQVLHDHVRGTSAVDPAGDPIAILAAHADGMTTRDLAGVLSGEGVPSRGAVEKARRELERLVRTGHATKNDGAAGGSGGGQQTRYRPTARHISIVS